MQIYKVGGAIRDKLLGLTIKDNDYVVVGATPEAMLEQGYQQVGQSFPVFLHPQSKDEYALARTERKIAEGYTGFSFDSRPTITLEEDLYRRDLTINAIAEDDNGVLIDPYGGQQDLDNKVLRHVSAHFVEDPLRVLRVARFAARYHGLGFLIANDTLTLMTQIASSGELQTLSPERIWQEMHSALCTDHAAVFFQTLRDTGALVQVMPEIDALFGVPQPAEHHPEIDCGVHTLMVLEQACKLSDEPLVRFAALTHDLGKATTSAEILPSHHGHENRGEKIAKKLCLRLHCPTSFADIAQLTAKYHTHIHRAFEIKPSTLLKTLMALDMLRRNERFKYILMACKADSRGRTGFESAPYPQYDYVLACAEAITALDQKTIISTVSEPSQIKQAIHDARLSAVKSVDKRAFSSA